MDRGVESVAMYKGLHLLTALLCCVLALIGVAATALADAPLFTTVQPRGGVYTFGQSVILTASRTADIHYTTDGSSPTTASPVYSSPIDVSRNTTLRFFAHDSSNNEDEPVKAQRYAIVRSGWGLSSGGYGHFLAVQADLTLWAWGNNSDGQLGDGSSGNTRNAPVQVRTSHGWTSLAAGRFHSVGLRADGTLWAWGRNDFGQLGDGTYTGRTVPAQVGTDTNWASLAPGWYYALAIKNDGTLWAWGDNSSGQLGDGTDTNRDIPVRVGFDTDWVSTSAGWLHTLALKKDGTLWAWGHNDSGQLGDGTGADKNSPVQVGIDKTWTSITAGSEHSLGLRADGTLWAWGFNSSGQLGDGSTSQQLSPVQIGAGSTWIAVAGGDDRTAAVKSDGSLWAWGQDCFGASSNTPVQVGSDTDWVSVTAGAQSFAALKSNGTLWTWGNSGYGQLGNGSTCGSLPAQVAAPAPANYDGYIRLAPGWNFISIGVQPLNRSIGDVLYGASPNIRVVWGYDNQNKVWKKYKFNAQDPALNTINKIDVGEGGWIYSDASVNVTVAGYDASPATQLFSGWNLTGYNKANGLSIDTGLANISDKWTIIWTWDHDVWTAQWQMPGTPPVGPIPAFSRGKAYWIKMRTGASW